MFLPAFYFTEIIDCGTPPNGTNTVPVPENLTLSYMDIYNYSCLAGYDTEDDIMAVCLINGSWSIEYPPVCSGK